jgi:Acetokinase family/3-hydroxyacyl-CoA dehydrogenase, NAD binding domain
MGQGIATACAGAGLDVLIADRSVDIAAQALQEIGQELDRDIAKWRYTASEKKAILGRLRAVDGLPSLETADLVIEAVPGGLDALAFAGGIGENAPAIRARALAGLESLGPALDESKNAAARGSEAEISPATAKPRVFVVPTNEELLIARDTCAIVSGTAPTADSARPALARPGG